MPLPDSLEKKRLLFDAHNDDAKVKTFADEYMKAERFHEALAFYNRLKDNAAMENILKRAVALGDLMLYQACCRHLGKRADNADLQAIADNAQKAGKEFYAAQVNAILHPETGEAEADGDEDEEE